MKKNNNNITLILLLISVFAILWIFYMQTPVSNETPSVQVTDTIELTAVDDSLIKSDSLDEAFQQQNTTDFTLPDTAFIDVPFVNQNPELPTGCEITSLTEVLNFYGFDIDKESLARTYLPMMQELQSGAYIYYFYGSPWSSNGSGCFSPAIVNAANAFLSDVSSPLRAHKLSYSDVNTLLSEVAQGNPVIVWTSFDYSIKPVTYREVIINDNEKFFWPTYEHCTVLTGYNLTDNTVTLTDPTYGIVVRSLEDFTYYYQMYFYQAVVIK